MATWAPTSNLAQAVHLAGFDYDPAQDIIYSRMDAWQRTFGYAYGYDKAALAANFAIDCEPIFFDYAGKVWMIELWKGQYMLETGCEIGIYTRFPTDTTFNKQILDNTIGKRDHDSVPSHNLFYPCATDEEMLQMSYTLLRDGQPLFTRGPEKHWWLTGFKWGVYSDPAQLIMNIAITFTDPGLQNAFVLALRGMGYTVNVTANQVSFVFDRPKTYQPRTSNATTLSQVNASNQQIAGAYASYHLPNNDPNQTPVGASAYVFKSIIQFQNFFSVIMNNDIGSLGDWAKAAVGLLGEAISMDDSTTVEFDNQSSSYTLVLNTYEAVNGNYLIAPPANIPPGTKGRLYLKDPKVFGGSNGWVSYALNNINGHSDTVKFSFNCPEGVFFSNKVSIDPVHDNIAFIARAGDGDWGFPNTVPASGYPLLVRFVITDTSQATLQVNIKINDYYLNAVGGGGIGDPPGFPVNSWPIHANATSIGPNETFILIPLGKDVNENSKFAIKTLNGHSITAVNGGGIGDPQGMAENSTPVHTNATQGLEWESFTLIPQGAGTGKFAIQTANGHYLTAVYGGGIADPTGVHSSVAIHTDATWIGAWETFTFVVKSGVL